MIWLRIGCAVRDILAATEAAQDLMAEHGGYADDRALSRLEAAERGGDARGLVRWSLVRDRIAALRRGAGH